MDRFHDLDETVLSVLFSQHLVERAWQLKVNTISRCHDTTLDAELMKLAQRVARYAVDLLRPQYEWSISDSTTYTTHHLSNRLCVVSYRPSDDNDDLPVEPPLEHTVDTVACSCSCMFSTTNLLPCRHVLYIRRHSAPDDIIPVAKIHERWLLKNFKMYNVTSCASDPPALFAQQRLPPQREPLVQRDRRDLPSAERIRYNALLSEAKSIADHASRLSPSTFESVRAMLARFADIVSSGRVPHIVDNASVPQVTDVSDAPPADVQQFDEVHAAPESTRSASAEEEVPASEPLAVTRSLAVTESLHGGLNVGT